MFFIEKEEIFLLADFRATEGLKTKPSGSRGKIQKLMVFRRQEERNSVVAQLVTLLQHI